MKEETALIDESDIKFITDSKGNRKEVVISYRKFRRLMRLIEDHIFLSSPDIQEQIKQSEEDIKAGRYIEAEADNIGKLLGWLDEKER